MAKRSDKISSLGETKLASSGLTLEDAKKLKIHILGPVETGKLHPSFKQYSSLKIDYLDPMGRPLPDWPSAPPFFRVRYLEQGAEFSNLTEKKQVRYVQAPNTAPVAYYPCNTAWPNIIEDPSQPIIITEGELKAAKACKEGFPTVGLGGVYNWRSLKLGVTWISSLDFVVWLRRNVYICFDSDYKTNSMVCQALKELANALHQKGAFVHIVSLPQIEGLEKVGLDDFLVHEKTAESFRTLLSDAEPLGLTGPLWSINDKYVYVQDPGLVVNRETGQKTTPAAFKDHQVVSVYQERTLNKEGQISYKPVSAANHWLHWPLRNEVVRLTYAPGEPEMISEPVPMLNSWPGWGCDPCKGDVKPFLSLIDHIFTGAEPEAKQWFMRWLAFPLQYPGVKMFSAVLIHGIRHGTGKSLIGYTMARIYGENFSEINQADLHNAFNGWAERRQFVMGDDITGSNKREDNDFLKKLITQETIRINQKFVPVYTLPDCINYFFTANHPDAFFLEDDDRRNFIHEVQVGPLTEKFYVDYKLWLDSTGPGAVFKYLIDLDLGDFNPAAPAFRTQAKERMIVNVQSDLGSWVRQLMATPDFILRFGEIVVHKDLFTSRELLAFYDPHQKGNTTANGVGRELARAGVRQVLGGKPVRLRDGSQHRYYMVRNVDKWSAASSQQVTKHLEDFLTRHKIEK